MLGGLVCERTANTISSFYLSVTQPLSHSLCHTEEVCQEKRRGSLCVGGCFFLSFFRPPLIFRGKVYFSWPWLAVPASVLFSPGLLRGPAHETDQAVQLTV